MIVATPGRLLDHLRFLPVRYQVVHGVAFAGLHEAEVTDASFGRRNQALAKRCGMNPVADGHALFGAGAVAIRHRRAEEDV